MVLELPFLAGVVAMVVEVGVVISNAKKTWRPKVLEIVRLKTRPLGPPLLPVLHVLRVLAMVRLHISGALQVVRVYLDRKARHTRLREVRAVR